MFKLPNDTERLTIIGRTGSGKTYYSIFHLSLRNYNNFRWLILNTKGEESFYKIPFIQPISFKDNILKSKGLFIIEPLPDEDEILNEYLLKIWESGNCGIFVDEAMDIGTLPAYKRILRQGRSKKIPIIQCIQRPSDRSLNRHIISESEYYQVFYLNDKRDRAIVSNFTTITDEDFDKLPIKKKSYWYDVSENQIFLLKEAPKWEIIEETFYQKLKERLNII